MKTVILALMGVTIGGGLGTSGGAFLLARCASELPEGMVAQAEHDEAEGSEGIADSLAVEPDAVGVVADSSDADPSTVADAAPSDTLAGDADAAAEPALPADAGAEVGPTAEDIPPSGAVDPVAPAVEPLVLAPTPDPTALRRLARIFSNMRAEQAAAVMVELTDEEAQRILVSMSERAAAAILGQMEATRAAVLSQKVLGASGGGDR